MVLLDNHRRSRSVLAAVTYVFLLHFFFYILFIGLVFLPYLIRGFVLTAMRNVRGRRHRDPLPSLCHDIFSPCSF